MVLGILGGMGPMSTAYFYKMLTEHTKAAKDSDHLDVVISGRASTPDRTEYILGNVADSPAPVILEESEKLRNYGAGILVLTCNTAHSFLSEIEPYVDIPFINMVDETAKICASAGCRRVGILSTRGTIASGIYEKALGEYGIDTIYPSEEDERSISSLIYGHIKAGNIPERKAFDEISASLDKKGADKIILACTELSMLKEHYGLDSHYIDALEVLCLRAIERCGKTPTGLDHLKI